MRKNCANARARENPARSRANPVPVALEISATARKNCADARKVREGAQMRFRSCEIAVPVALAICAIARQNCALLRKNCATVRKVGPGRAEICLRPRCKFARLRVKTCPDVRKTARSCENPAPAARKFGPGSVRFLRDCAENCASVRKSGSDRAKIRILSR